ncbi:MAG TPA: carboxymuconolactone decarboxylase family protein [Xanthobacteraceae bacterium]|jgi:alkylhydroperoxidase family enzyme|nr:carboxymuconolactone decarboxylase family protein [Xanthobacteraceae bacterium]
MARVPYIAPEDFPENFRGLISSDANITRALANSPNVALQSGTVARYIREKSRLDPRLRELAIIQVGYTAKSAYEYSHHIEIGLRYGVSGADIRAIALESKGQPSDLEPLAKCVLRAAREMTTNLAISDATFAELKLDLDNERLVELIFAIATYNGVVRMLESLKVDVEPKYQQYLERFPL